MRWRVEKGGKSGGVFTSLLVERLGEQQRTSLETLLLAASTRISTSRSDPGHNGRYLRPTSRALFLYEKRRRRLRLFFVELRALATHFPMPGFDFKLDPAYEPERNAEQRKD